MKTYYYEVWYYIGVKGTDEEKCINKIVVSEGDSPHESVEHVKNFFNSIIGFNPHIKELEIMDIRTK